MNELSAEEWRQVERVYEGALNLAIEAREAYVAEACASTPSVKVEVESLLNYASAARSYLTRPALEQVARTLGASKPGVLTGRQIHGYALQSLLGVGGMGEVYLARDLRLGRDVALKVLSDSATVDPGYLRRFEAEARSASVLNHPNIVTIYGVGEEGDVRYIVMERVNGRTLREIAASADLAVPAVLDLAVQLADALAVAHDNGIVHRDLKPDNVMVTPDGLLKVLDFGIARREGAPDAVAASANVTELPAAETQAGTILGTVGYMSPEQADGRRASPASDQFSFGVILYELLTGQRAFERPGRSETLDAIRHEEPQEIQTINANVEPSLRRLVSRCLTKDPSARYARSRDLAAELRGIRDRRTGGGLSRRQVIWLGAAASVAVATAGWWGWWLGSGPRVGTLALLPFENLSGDPEIDALCNGLTDDLIGRIHELPQITVKPPSLVSNFKRSGMDARAFARRIDAGSVLTGTIRGSGSDLAIQVSLAEAESGKQIWSYPFTHPKANLQTLRDDIATEIVANGIRLHLSAEERSKLVRHSTDNPRAFELLLRSSSLTDEESPNAAIERRDLLRQAIELDPNYAEAYAEVAGSFLADAVNGYAPPEECWRGVSDNLIDAVSLDRDLPLAYAAMGTLQFFYHRDWAHAEKTWRQFMTSRGGTLHTARRAARPVQVWALGRTEEAIRLIREVRGLDGLSVDFMNKESMFLRTAERFEEAATLSEAALNVDPQNDTALGGLAEARFGQRQFDDAIAILSRLYAGSSAGVDRALATARGADGYHRIEQAVAKMRLEDSDRASAAGFYVAPISRARWCAVIGDGNNAFKALEEAFSVGDPGVVFLKVDVAWSAWRKDPRYEAAVKRVGFPPA